MNTPVSFEIAKELKEKGFDEKCSHYYINDFQNFKHDGKLYKTSLPNDWDNENIFQYVKRTNQPHLCNAPTIAEVVMWVHKEKGLWVNVMYMGFELKYSWSIDMITTSGSDWDSYGEEGDICYKSPIEAYEAAIEYTLKNLI